MPAPIFSVINTEYPLHLDSINLQNEKNRVHLNDGIEAKIRNTVADIYYNILSGDSANFLAEYSESYIKTLRLHDSAQTLYLILYRHLPGNEVNSKVLFYNNTYKTFSPAKDFKLYALYDFDGVKLNPSNLKKAFNIQEPEIEITDFNKDGINDYRFNRLYHNGTFNSLQSTVLAVNKNKIDTLDFKEKTFALK
ncbi:MAG: hypothetical protein KA149_10785 [Chitinophagales bacterium]|nr:hypothetical protein [Chitinophagales bacterium]